MSNKKVNYIISDQNVTVNYDGQTHIIPRVDGLADQIIQALKDKRNDDIPDLVDASSRIKKFSKGSFTVQNGDILVNGVVAPAALGKKILKFSNEGLPYEPLVKFAEKLLLNPSFRAVHELFQFLEKNDHPLTEDGNFIAYKRVRENFTDIHSGTFDNSVGNFIQIPRNQVDEDSSRTCSNGLHVANWDYAHNHFASSSSDTDVMLEVEVDPADVVAIPNDYNNAKMRVCAYKVLSVIDKEHSSDTHIRYTKTVSDLPHYDHHYDDESEEENNDWDESSEDEDEDDLEDESPKDKYPWEDELV